MSRSEIWDDGNLELGSRNGGIINHKLRFTKKIAKSYEKKLGKSFFSSLQSAAVSTDHVGSHSGASLVPHLFCWSCFVTSNKNRTQASTWSKPPGKWKISLQNFLVKGGVEKKFFEGGFLCLSCARMIREDSRRKFMLWRRNIIEAYFNIVSVLGQQVFLEYSFLWMGFLVNIFLECFCVIKSFSSAKLIRKNVGNRVKLLRRWVGKPSSWFCWSWLLSVGVWAVILMCHSEA